MAQTAGTSKRARDSAEIEREVARLYDAYADRIFGYCLYRLGNRTEAEDAVQTTFLYVFRGLQRGVVPEVESSWLFTIAHNVCRSTRRSVRRRRRVESQQDPQLLQELSPGVERDNDSLLGLEDALASIPENQRRAILLREWQGMPYREIAETLGLSQTAVEMLVFRARRSLADALVTGRKPTAARRVARALNFGNLVSALKSFFGGLSASHVAAAASAVVVAAAAGADPSPVVNHSDAPAPAPANVVRHPRAAAELAPVVARSSRAKPTSVAHTTKTSAAVAAGGTASTTPTAPPADASGAPVASSTSTPASPSTANAPPSPTPAVDVPATPSASVTVPATPVTPPITTTVPDVDVPSVSVDVQQAVEAVKSAVSSVTQPQLP